MSEYLTVEGMTLERIGKCDSKKCKAACCRFFMLGKPAHKGLAGYQKGFFQNENEFGDLFLEKNCKHLDTKKNKCKLWGTPDFPEVCKQFPSVTDKAYRQVMDVCEFKFVAVKHCSPKCQSLTDDVVMQEEGRDV